MPNTDVVLSAEFEKISEGQEADKTALKVAVDRANAVTDEQLENVIPVSTMISGLLVGAGVGLIVLFKMNKGIKENLKITGLLYAIGVISGIIIQLVGIQF